jgi:P pilus assembly chaperone PapD
MDLQRRQLHANGRLHALLTLTTVALLGAVTPTGAQTSVEVTPLRLELKAAPGGATTQAITISNSGKEPVRVRATVSDWHLSRDGSPQFVAAADLKYSASPWVRVAPPEIVVDAGREAVVRFTLTVPAATPPSGYRTGILFEFGPASGSPVPKPREVAFKSRIATLIYANVGEPPAAVELVDLRSRTLPDQPVSIVAIVKNTGQRTVRTRGTLTLYDRSGAAVSTTVIPDVPVLPESEREVAIPALNPDKPRPAPGEYRVEIKLDVGMPALIVGETTLKVS